MTDPSAQRAIKAALAGNWDEAIEFNLQTLKTEPENIEALNRLARAYAAVGQTKNAHKTYNKVLHFDPYNSIATHQLQKIKIKSKSSEPTAPRSAQTFLDEPGKTKTTYLTRLANSKILMSLEPGQTVSLLPKSRNVTITTETGEYLGTLPDDLSAHLSQLISAGNKYEAIVRRVEKNSLTVFIKEVSRAKKYEHVPSFSTSKNHLVNLDSLPTILNEPPVEVSPTGEDDYQ